MKFVIFGLLMLATPVCAADHRVEMLNKGPDGKVMVFSPRLVHADPGDTVTFVPTDKAHNSISLKGGIPMGAAEWKGKMGAKVVATVSAEGVYVFECVPHTGMGMIGAIVVGKPVNLVDVKALKYPGKASAVAAEIFAEIEKAP